MTKIKKRMWCEKNPGFIFWPYCLAVVLGVRGHSNTDFVTQTFLFFKLINFKTSAERPRFQLGPTRSKQKYIAFTHINRMLICKILTQCCYDSWPRPLPLTFFLIHPNHVMNSDFDFAGSYVCSLCASGHFGWTLPPNCRCPCMRQETEGAGEEADFNLLLWKFYESSTLSRQAAEWCFHLGWKTFL